MTLLTTNSYLAGRHALPAGAVPLQLDPQKRRNWPDPEETGWNNVAAFLRYFGA